MNEIKFPILATGRRKTSTAKVFLYPGSGRIIINGKDIDEYFGEHLYHKSTVKQPLTFMGEEANMYDFRIETMGGGITGNAEAIRLGIARALSTLNPEKYRYMMRKAGFLTRDPRMVERKKAGKPKARKSFQWTKR